MYSNRYVLHYIRAKCTCSQVSFWSKPMYQPTIDIHTINTYKHLYTHTLKAPIACVHIHPHLYTLLHAPTPAHTHTHTHLIHTYSHACYVHTYAMYTFYTQFCISHSTVHLEVRIGTVPWSTTTRGWPTTRPVERPSLYKHCRTYSLRYKQLWPHPLY